MPSQPIKIAKNTTRYSTTDKPPYNDMGVHNDIFYITIYTLSETFFGWNITVFWLLGISLRCLTNIGITRFWFIGFGACSLHVQPSIFITQWLKSIKITLRSYSLYLILPYLLCQGIKILKGNAVVDFLILNAKKYTPIYCKTSLPLIFSIAFILQQYYIT